MGGLIQSEKGPSLIGNQVEADYIATVIELRIVGRTDKNGVIRIGSSIQPDGLGSFALHATSRAGIVDNNTVIGIASFLSGALYPRLANNLDFHVYILIFIIYYGEFPVRIEA